MQIRRDTVTDASPILVSTKLVNNVFIILFIGQGFESPHLHKCLVFSLKRKTLLNFMKNFMRLFLFAALVSLFSFAPKHTAFEAKQALTVDYYTISLTNPVGWDIRVFTTTPSSTYAVTVKFICDIHEPNGTVLSNVNQTFFNVPGNNNNTGQYGYEYYEIISVPNSGYPAGSYSANVHSVTASVYVPF